MVKRPLLHIVTDFALQADLVGYTSVAAAAAMASRLTSAPAKMAITASAGMIWMNVLATSRSMWAWSSSFSFAWRRRSARLSESARRRSTMFLMEMVKMQF